MKKVLLGTTALIGAAVLAAPAQAQLEVTVGGAVGFQAGWFDNDSATNNDRDFQSEADIVVEAKGVADNGLQYGATVKLQSSTSDTDNADETYLTLGGDNWGSLEFGDNDGASELGVTAPTVGIGQINGSADDFIFATDRGHPMNDRGDARFKPLDTDDDTKVTYYTPTFMGFQGGVSYAPEALTSTTDGVGENVAITSPADGFSDVVELGLHYSGEFSGVGVTVGGQYNFGQNNEALDEDLAAWGLGAQLSYMGFKVGGGYTDNGDSGSIKGTAADTVTSWNVGATYESGPWGVGVSYLDVDLHTNGDNTTAGSGTYFGTDGAGGDYREVAFGGTYTVAPGLTTGVDVSFYDRNRPAAADTNGSVVMGEVKAAF